MWFRSFINTLVLNGRSVVRYLEMLSGSRFHSEHTNAWVLQRKSGANVTGFAYWGTLTAIHGIPLGREVKILGYNHNVQSSFGITREIKLAIQTCLAVNLMEKSKCGHETSSELTKSGIDSNSSRINRTHCQDCKKTQNAMFL